MQELLMFMYHLTPEQAAARVPLFQFWLDNKGVFDGFGEWLACALRDTRVGDLLRKFM